MKSGVRLALFLLLVAAVSAGTCYLVGRFARQRKPADTVAYHYWVHRQLNITPEQDEALEPIEKQFAERRKDLVEKIRVANRELAAALRADQQDRVRDAVAKIHRAQGELQEAVLEH